MWSLQQSTHTQAYADLQIVYADLPLDIDTPGDPFTNLD